MIFDKGTPEGSGVSWALWADSQTIVQDCLKCSFVQGLATGNIERWAFQAYIAQDHYYLVQFARAYELLEQKCHPELDKPAVAEIAQAARTFRLRVDEELESHRSLVSGGGVDSSSIQPTKTTLAYTEFLLKIAEEEGPMEILTAMAPCARLYGYIGVQLTTLVPSWHTSPYSKWVATYSSPEYLAFPALKERLLDQLVDQVSTVKDGPDLSIKARLQTLYTRAMELELDFFMAHVHVIL